jgi:hypothetical protein
MLCSWVDHCFRGTCCLHLQSKIIWKLKAAGFFKTSVMIRETKCHRIPEGRDLCVAWSLRRNILVKNGEELSLTFKKLFIKYFTEVKGKKR